MSMKKASESNRGVVLPQVAFVLAAGLGTRMRPLTERTPKPLLPLWGKPILQWTLETLKHWGVRRVLVNVHHAPEALLAFVDSKPVPGLELTALVEPEILGTGGGLRAAADYLPPDEEAAFWLVNGDIAFQGLRPEAFGEALAGWPEAIAACWAVRGRGPRTLRIEQMAPHRILAFSAPKRCGSATFAGVQLVRRAILRHVRPTGFDTIIDAYGRAQEIAGRPVVAVEQPAAYWADLGTPAQYVQAHHDLALSRAPASGASFELPLAAAFDEQEREALCAGVPQLAAVPEADLPFVPLEALAARASQRQFYRLRGGAGAGGGTSRPGADKPSMLVKYSLERADNALYAPLTRHLAAHGVPVPRLLLDRPDLQVLAIEDLGRTSLQELVAELHLKGAPADEFVRLYRPLMATVRRFHELPPPSSQELPVPLSAPYDRETALWEIEYFDEHFLGGALRVSAYRRAAIRRRLRGHIQPLLDSPQGTIHRDLQSSNVLYPVPTDAEHPVFIDYQALRRGPLAYDLASLLLDPYADLPDKAVRVLLQVYGEQIRDERERAGIIGAFRDAAALRLAQALGAYARLCRLPGMAHFAEYIVPARRRLRAMLPELRIP